VFQGNLSFQNFGASLPNDDGFDEASILSFQKQITSHVLT
jgi:hypothetical protein